MRRFLGLFFLLASTQAFGATYYVDDDGNDTTGDGSTSAPYKTLDKVWAVNTSLPLDVVVKDGVYSYAGMEFDNGMDKGTSWASSVTIRAENRFGARITLDNALDMGNVNSLLAETTWYTQFNGFIFDYPSQKNITGHQWKFFNCGFKGGETSGNNSNLSIGTSDFGASKPGASGGLIEDCYFVGYSTGSSRYQMLAYNVREFIARRVVGWVGDGYTCSSCGNPSAVFTIYNSEKTWILNPVVLDITSPPDFMEAALYYVNNENSIPMSANQSGFEGGVVVNVVKGDESDNVYGMRFEGGRDISSATVRNCAFIDTDNGGISFGAGTEDRTILAENNTLVLVSTRTTGIDKTGLGDYSSGSTVITVRNTILANWPTAALNGVSGTYLDCSGNGGSACGGTGTITSNPRTNGMRYFTRIESGSTLKTAGLSGGQIGAEIVNKIGTSGTLYGETGWNTLTADALWPWPNETHIRQELCRAYSTDMCGTSYTLTEWVNGYGSSPYAADTSSPTAPTNVSTTAVTSSAITWSWTAATDDVGVSAYEIDVDDDSGFGSPVSGYNDLNVGNVTSYQVTGLSASTVYYIRVRAKDAAGNTGSNSSTGNGATSAAAGATGGAGTRGARLRGGAGIR